LVYLKIKSTKIPFFDDEILFTNYGLKHIFLDSNNEYRKLDEIQNRIKIFTFLPRLLTLPTSNQEIRLVEKARKLIRYWAFVYDYVSAQQSFRLKLIVRQIEDNSKEFASVMQIPQTKFKPPIKEADKS
jgi:hypothetical protein